ncbi:MAG: FAD-linked oxidase C-terminal domain-containing protein [Verrucomicrobiota bacterium]|nr:FAD-binding protein [Limisphaera sp.]MDW8381429.1 FAD-linked oxidase C-terminal domain-containing protein [Verrucomicrobiota bacterium]
MTSTQQRALLSAANCEVAFDNVTRQLYATDASIYQVEPAAVAFPRNARQASAVIKAAAQAGLSVIPRGAGTGLTGGALGEGVVVDFARHLRSIRSLDRERAIVEVEAGVVLDQLNAFLRPHGFMFGPDVATSDRATLGGMIASNSSGARAPWYGTTADHVVALEVVLADGRVRWLRPGEDPLPLQRRSADDVVQLHGLRVQERMPPGLVKRWPGYALDRYMQRPGDLTQLICGSEGTLAGILAAVLRVVPLPKQKALGVLFFDSRREAMEVAVALRALRPAAVEHLDRLLLDQTRGRDAFAEARRLLALDERRYESVLVVEFLDEVNDKLFELERLRAGQGFQAVQDERQMGLVWTLRKAGLSLLTSRPGPAKPVTIIEDTAVVPDRLPAYVEALEALLEELQLEASFYGHAGSGLLHVRPVLDLHRAEDVRRLRQVAEGVSRLVACFGGSLAAEHGVGIARTEFMEEQLGEDLLGAMREIKRSFDPHGVLNPGKIIPDGRYRCDKDLRLSPARALKLPFEPVLAFAARDGSFVAHLEQCNGCGGCRKLTPVMCPTFPVTGEEALSTRGRVNLVRAALEGRGLEGRSVWESEEFRRAVETCLGCRACVSECPSNVDMGLLKAELLQGRNHAVGMPWGARLVSRVDQVNAWLSRVPSLANEVLGWRWVRALMERSLGVAAERPLPAYARQRFDRWFAQRSAPSWSSRGRVLLWDDTFIRYHEPGVGMAAVAVLEALGYEVSLIEGRRCCGRPAFSQGDLQRARALGQWNLSLLEREPAGVPVIFLEPSCYSMFVEDYHELGLAGASGAASRCVLFETFVEAHLAAHPDSVAWEHGSGLVLVHAHCHVKCLGPVLARLAGRLPGRTVRLLDSGCCGMAGAFGAMAATYELSLRVAEPLVEQIEHTPFGTVLVASGTSCRQQVAHLSAVPVLHMAQLLARALPSSGPGFP